MLVALLAIPLAAAVVAAALGPRRLDAIRWVSLAATLAALVLAAVVAVQFASLPPRDNHGHTFRPEFVPAFKAWVAEDPIHNTAAIASPLLMQQYKVANFEKADRLDHVGDVRFEQAKEATEHADDYIFGTVFFAAVLFFAEPLLLLFFDIMTTTSTTAAAASKPTAPSRM